MKKSLKAYKTIGEVAEILELDSIGNKKNTHTIRYWESEFKQIKPIIINKRRHYDDKNIDLFINIASFQEMDYSEIFNYFDIMKNNKSILYCCNRENKKLPCGEEISFHKYPWNNSKIIFWEDCPWHQRFYTSKFPFIKKYDGNVIHCMANFSE